MDVAEPLLRRALKEPDLETRLRVQNILSKLRSPSGRALQALRAVEVLERIATPDARRLLARLARGEPQARLTREATASSQRLKWNWKLILRAELKN